MLVNAIAFQLAWFAALYGVLFDQAKLGAIPALLATVLHLFHFRRTLREEAMLMGVVLLIGLAVEWSYLMLGIIIYAGAPILPGGPPLWIMTMWLAFGTLPHGCLAWLDHRPILQAILGGISAPFSYLAGARLGAASLTEPNFQSLLLIGAGWALALPLMFLFADRLRPRR